MMNMLVKLHNHVRVSILQLCDWGGAGTHQGFVKHMKKYHTDGKSPQLLLASVLLHHQLCAVDDFDLIGPPEFEGKMLPNIR